MKDKLAGSSMVNVADHADNYNQARKTQMSSEVASFSQARSLS